jgi:threonine synthase
MSAVWATEGGEMRDMYKKLDTPEGLELCPCCGASAELWQYAESDTSPTSKVVCCSTGDPFGPQDGIAGAGCLLFMPPESHYRATAREAIKHWNEYAKALTALQRKNRWEKHSALRGAQETTSKLTEQEIDSFWDYQQ